MSVHIAFAESSLLFDGTMSASFTVDGTIGGYLSIADFDLRAVSNWGVFVPDTQAAVSNFRFGSVGGVGDSTASVSGSHINGFYVGQHAIFGPTDNSSPIVLATWTMTWLDQAGIYYTGIETDAPNSFAVMDHADGTFGSPDTYGSSVVTSAQIFWTPGVGTMGVLSAGAMPTSRCRR